MWNYDLFDSATDNAGFLNREWLDTEKRVLSVHTVQTDYSIKTLFPFRSPSVLTLAPFSFSQFTTEA